MIKRQYCGFVLSIFILAPLAQILITSSPAFKCSAQMCAVSQSRQTRVNAHAKDV